MKSGMLPWLAIILSVGMLILFLLPLVLDVNRFRSRYLPVLERVLQRPVAVQNVRLTFFPRLGIRLQGLTIADDPAINSAPFLTIPSAEIVFQWKSLLHRSLQVENVRLQNPVVHLIRTTDGSLNTATIGQAPDPQSEKSPGEPHAQPGNFHPFLLGIFGIEQFAVTGGTLKYEDRSREQFHVYRLKNLKMETRFFHMGQTADIRIQGTMLPLGLPFSLQWQLGPLQPTADITRIHAVGTFGNNEVTAQGAVNDGRLELNVHVPRVSSTDFHQGWPLAESLEFQQLQARLIASFDPEEGMPLFSGVAVDPLTFNVHFNKSILHVSGDGSAERLTLRGTSPAVIIPVRALPDIPQGSVELEQLIVETEVQEGSIQFKSIQARIFEGTLEAQGEWQRKSSVPSLYFKGQFTQFAVEPLLRDLFPSSLELTGTGDLHWNIGGARSSSAPAVLKGPVRLRIRDGAIRGFDLLHRIEEILQLPGLLGHSSTAADFSLMEASGDLDEKGLTLRQVFLKTVDISLKGAGRVGLNQKLDLQGTLTFSPVISDRIRQHFPKAKAVGQQGELILPFVVQGNVREPVLQLDFQSMGKQVKKNLEQRLQKVLQGDDQELQQMWQDGKAIWKQLFEN